MLTSGAAGRGWRLVAAVFVLAVAVVAMHSLGAGHHGAAPVGHGSHQSTLAATDEAHGPLLATGSGSHHHTAGSGGATVPDEAVKSVVTVTCLGCSTDGGDVLNAMCLAVVSSLLGLALLLALRHLLRVRVALAIPPRWRTALAPRSPLRRVALSPIEVRVLRT